MRAMVIHLGAPLPAASSNQPGSTDGPSLTLPYLVLLLVGFTWHPTSPPDPVSSYLTLSPLPAEAGGLLSVALIPGVTPAGRYPASYPVEPGLSSLREEERPPVLLQPNWRNGLFPLWRRKSSASLVRRTSGYASAQLLDSLA